MYLEEVTKHEALALVKLFTYSLYKYNGYVNTSMQQVILMVVLLCSTADISEATLPMKCVQYRMNV